MGAFSNTERQINVYSGFSSALQDQHVRVMHGVGFRDRGVGFQVALRNPKPKNRNPEP